MDQTNRFALMLEALTELAAEDDQTRPAGTGLDRPSLSDILSSAGSFPPEALFLGLAEDGLPVLLNLYDAVPGPLLVTGDQASGKTALLQTIARAAEKMHAPSEVEYGIITNRVDEWGGFQDSQHCAGIHAMTGADASDFIQSLVSWAHNNHGHKQAVILLIDDLESASKLNGEAEQNLRWLLLRGPSRRVWPVVTLNASRVDQMQSWLGFFRTRLFGHMGSAHDAAIATGLDDIEMGDLIPGAQFTMREENDWLTFWIPTLD